MSFFVNRVEKKVKTALRSGNLADFLNWLEVLTGEPFKLKHLKHTLSNGVTLLDYAAAKSNQLNDKFLKKPGWWPTFLWQWYRFTSFQLPAQSIISLISQAIMGTPKDEKPLSSWQEYYKNKIHSKQKLQAPEANSQRLIKEVLFDKFINKFHNNSAVELKGEQEEKADSPSQSYQKNTPTNFNVLATKMHLPKKQFEEHAKAFQDQQILRPEPKLNNAALREGMLKARVTLPPEALAIPNSNEFKEYEKKNNTLPEHLRHWVQKTILVQQLNYNQEQKNQLENQLEHKTNANTNEDMLFGKNKEQDRYLDSSNLTSLEFEDGTDVTYLAQAIKLSLERKHGLIPENEDAPVQITVLVSEKLREKIGLIASTKAYGGGFGSSSWDL